MFLFSHLTYLVQLLYLGKLSQEDAILIKNTYLSKGHGTQRLLSELSDKDWKL